VLEYLHRRGFAAPVEQQTSDGAILASYQGWTALLLPFLEGEDAYFARPCLVLLAECVAHPHTCSQDARAEAESAGLPDSPLRLTPSGSQAIDQLAQALQKGVRQALRL
jgi:hypothetical protein